MRARQLRKRDTSLVRSANEENPKPSPWGKLIYFSFLTGLVVIGCWWGYERAVYIKGVGFLKTRVTTLEATSAGQIAEIKCEINDRVKGSQPLVFLADSVSLRNRASSFDAYSNERKIIETRKKIRSLRQEVAYQNQQVSRFEEELANAGQLLQQQAITLADHNRIEDGLRTTRLELNRLQIELDAEIETLRSYKREASLIIGTTPSQSLAQRAPVSGIVSAVFKQPGEVVRLGDPILEILSEEQDFIATYFEGEFEKSLVVGEQVAVHFENGDACTGRIRRIYPSTLPQPPEINYRFGKFRRFIIAEVVPVDAPVWRRIYDTQAEIQVEKPWLSNIPFLRNWALKDHLSRKGSP